MCTITAVPQMPDYVRGVINLRGTVLAVLDLRAKFRMEPIEYNDRACIIVLEAGSRRLALSSTLWMMSSSLELPN